MTYIYSYGSNIICKTRMGGYHAVAFLARNKQEAMKMIKNSDFDKKIKLGKKLSRYHREFDISLYKTQFNILKGDRSAKFIFADRIITSPGDCEKYIKENIKEGAI